MPEEREGEGGREGGSISPPSICRSSSSAAGAVASPPSSRHSLHPPSPPPPPPPPSWPPCRAWQRQRRWPWWPAWWPGPGPGPGRSERRWPGPPTSPPRATCRRGGGRSCSTPSTRPRPSQRTGPRPSCCGCRCALRPSSSRGAGAGPLRSAAGRPRLCFAIRKLVPARARAGQQQLGAESQCRCVARESWSCPKAGQRHYANCGAQGHGISDMVCCLSISP